MTITKKEAERLSLRLLSDITNPLNDECAAALRSLAAERDALQAENASLQNDFAHTEEARDRQHTRADRLQAENARLRRIKPND